MSFIDGIEVAIYKCDCGCPNLWFFRGQNSEGYKIACSKCGKDQRELLDELKLLYLWRHQNEKDGE